MRFKSFLLPLFVLLSCSQAESEYLAGVSKTEKLDSPYVTSGDCAYCIGSQDGSFPDMGWHSHGEMWGIWAPAIKLADGFEMTVSSDKGQFPLDNADIYTTYPYGNSFHYSDVLPGLDIVRFQFIPQGKPKWRQDGSIREKEPKRLEFCF